MTVCRDLTSIFCHEYFISLERKYMYDYGEAPYFEVTYHTGDRVHKTFTAVDLDAIMRAWDFIVNDDAS